MSELRGQVAILNPLGLHARPAALLVALAQGYRSQIVLEKDGQRARATSVLELLMLCAQQGSQLEVCVQGDDAAEAITAVCALFEAGFEEPT